MCLINRQIRIWTLGKTLLMLMLWLPLVVTGLGQDTRGVGVRTTTEKRLALVIGNADYQSTTKLTNPSNDATDMAATLKTLGFEVLSGTNQSKREMEALIRQFGEKLAKQGGVGLFFYAGHGIQYRGGNYLVPVEANIPAEDEIEYASINLGFLLNKMEAAQNNLNIVILDACRNNPFARSWRNYRDIGDNIGLAKVTPPTGTIMLYATQPGNVASDGSGRNGLFTESLLQQIKKPNVEFDAMVKALARDVSEKSGKKQLPWKEGIVLGDFYFAGAQTVEIDRNAAEREAWNQIKDSTNRSDFVLFIESFPNGIYAGQAKAKWQQVWWNSIKNSSRSTDFNDFLKQFPTGQYAEAAKFALKRLESGTTTVSSPINPTNSSGVKAGTLISNKLGMKFAYIPPGSFQMGESGDIHTVTISQGFYLGSTEVTQTQWVSVMFNNPSSFNNCDNCPVENVSWEDVQAFIKKLNDRGDGKYRLPTEAEWEYAARAGSTTKYSFGDGEGSLGSYAWYDANSGSRTHDVATKQPNAWGLYDMHGNVWEWVQDWYGDYPNGAVTNPRGATTGSDRVFRGGSWGSSAMILRSAGRSADAPLVRDQFLGFRLVRY